MLDTYCRYERMEKYLEKEHQKTLYRTPINGIKQTNYLFVAANKVRYRQDASYGNCSRIIFTKHSSTEFDQKKVNFKKMHNVLLYTFILIWS